MFVCAVALIDKRIVKLVSSRSLLIIIAFPLRLLIAPVKIFITTAQISSNAMRRKQSTACSDLWPYLLIQSA
jgi:hypothetical protein